MIGLILIYFIGKAFYDLAMLYQKHKWGFAILGVASYYLGLMVGGVIIALLMELNSPGSVERFNETALGALGIPFGILACWGLYKFLQRQWGKPAKFTDEEIIDSDIIE